MHILHKMSPQRTQEMLYVCSAKSFRNSFGIERETISVEWCNLTAA